MENKKALKVQQVYDLIRKRARVLIYPAGGMANDFANSIEFESLNVIAFADRDERKWSRTIKGCEIIGPNDICKLDPDTIIVAASVTARNSIYSDLSKLGLEGVEILQMADLPYHGKAQF